jgi:DNA replication protein DnaC
MNPELESASLWEYFKELGCDELPSINERDAEVFLRHRVMCRECRGFDDCKERGYVMLFSLSPDKKTAYPAYAQCAFKKAHDARRKSEKLFLEAAIPLGLQRCRLENYVTEGLGESVKRARNVAMATARSAHSLVLAGDVGTGKTHLAAGIVHAALAQGRDALFISAIGYLERLKSTFEKKQTDLYMEMVDHVKSVSCLAVDDFGAERPSVWTIARLYDVINTRVERGAQTIVTTNYTHAGAMIRRLDADMEGAKRIVSRLISFGWVIVEGKDYRGRNCVRYIDR